MKRLKFTLVGVGRVLMHNGRTADPTNEHSKAIAAAIQAAKKSDTPENIESSLKAKFMGGLYHTTELGLCFPADAVLTAIVKASSTALKRGAGKKIKAGVDLPEDVEFFQFSFDGYDRDRDTPTRLYEQGHRLVKGVVINKSRVQGCRPCFKNWQLNGELLYDPKVISLEDLAKVLRAAGAGEGIGDWRPRFGRFNVEFDEKIGSSEPAESTKKRARKEAA